VRFIKFVDQITAVFSLSFSVWIAYKIISHLQSISLNATSRNTTVKKSKLLRNISNKKQTTTEVALTKLENIVADNIVDPDDVNVSFSDIGGLESVKEALNELLILPIKRPDLFQNRKLASSPKGILLYGPPGTGKTLLAKAAAKECQVVFINLNWSTIMSRWFGESEQLSAAVFSLARKLQPCIIFIDEIDSFLRSRNSMENDASGRVKALFLSLWDGLDSSEQNSIIIIGATNRPNDIDEAIKRRMPRRFLVDLPNVEQRERILQIILSGETLDEDVIIKTIAELTDKYSGSDLKELCRTASFAPIREYLVDEKAAKTTSCEEVTNTNENNTNNNINNTDNNKKPRAVKLADFVEAMQSIRPNHEPFLFGKNSIFGVR